MKISYTKANNLFYYSESTGVLLWKSGEKMNQVAGFNNDGYLYVSINKKGIPTHKIVWLLHHKEWPDQIDHINRNRSDNRIENLRKCTNSQNQMNRSIGSNNTSGHKGVSLRGKRWKSKITKDGIDYHLGYFEKKEDAIKAYIKARVEMYGKFA